MTIDVSLLWNVIAALTPLVVPILTDLLKKIVPLIPTQLIPVVATVLGVIITVLNSGLSGGTVAVGATLGFAGVGVREVVNQLVTGQNSAAVRLGLRRRPQ
jgi:drug/metabolite transporter (DMT)-like permease